MRPNVALVGVTKQTAKGSAGIAATATYGHGITSGGVHRLEVDHSEIETSGTRRIAGEVVRTSAIPGIAFSALAFPKSIGAWLYGALGGLATTGTTNYTHTFSPGTDLLYWTIYGRQDAEYVRVEDARIASLGFKFDGPGPVEVDVDAIGITAAYEAATWTATNDDSTAECFKSVGGTLQFAGTGSTPASARIKAGEIKFENSVGATILASAITPSDIAAGRLRVTCSLTIVPSTDLSDWQKIITNTGTGTSVQNAPVYGSVDLKFTIDANTELQFQFTRVAFVGSWPDADVSGGDELEIQVEGLVVENTGNTAVKAILKNQTATY